MTHEFLLPWLALAAVQLAATISPGPAFAMTVRNATVHGRAAGAMTAIGLGQGVGVHVILVLTGISILLTKIPFLFMAIKYAGAAYLIYIGIKALGAKPKEAETINPNEKPKNPNRNLWSFMTQGFMTNLLNPKAWVFYAAVFSQFITPETPLAIMILYGFTDVAIETVWFTLLSVFLTHPPIRARFIAISHWIERICGGLLIALGVKLALSKL
jgi:RhtB (resistance to homoserine/threonine) family protein